MKTYKQIVQETVDAPRSADERRFLQKHVVKVTDYPVDNPEPKTKMKKRRGDLTDGEDKKVYEEVELDEAVMQGSKEHLKKLQDMLDKVKPGSADHSQIRGAIESMFGKKHIPAKHRNVKPNMYEEVDLDESFKAGSMKLRDGSSVTLSNEDAAAFNELYKNLNPDNKNKMQKRLESNEKAFNEVLAFAKEAM